MAQDEFARRISEAYAAEGASIDLGRGIVGDELVPGAVVQLPASMANRHGLIAGATGTGKRKRCSCSRSSCRPSACPSSPPTSRVTSAA
jgi:hypothetical protein